MLQKWKHIINNWINCYFDENDSEHHNVSIKSLLNIISHLRYNLNLDESKSSVLEANTVEEFILEKYPSFKFENGTSVAGSEEDVYLVASLLLFFVCVNSKNVDLKSAMCSKLSGGDQEIILKFSKNLMECSPITCGDVHTAITEACGQETLSMDTGHVAIPETPPALRSLHGEVRRLQAALDAERFDRNYLQEELSRTNLRVEKLVKDKEKYKLDILNLTAKISMFGGGEHDARGADAGNEEYAKLTRQLNDMEERLVRTQEQLDDASSERDGLKKKLEDLKADRDKWVAISQQESARAGQLANELETERRHLHSLKELVTELRQHNRLNGLDSSQLECDDPDASIQSLTHNISICSEACANIIEVQLSEERVKVDTLKQQIQTLQAENEQLHFVIEEDNSTRELIVKEKDSIIDKLEKELKTQNLLLESLRKDHEIVTLSWEKYKLDVRKVTEERDQQMAQLNEYIASLHKQYNDLESVKIELDKKVEVLVQEISDAEKTNSTKIQKLLKLLSEEEAKSSMIANDKEILHKQLIEERSAKEQLEAEQNHLHENYKLVVSKKKELTNDKMILAQQLAEEKSLREILEEQKNAVSAENATMEQKCSKQVKNIKKKLAKEVSKNKALLHDKETLTKKLDDAIIAKQLVENENNALLIEKNLLEENIVELNSFKDNLNKQLNEFMEKTDILEKRCKNEEAINAVLNEEKKVLIEDLTEVKASKDILIKEKECLLTENVSLQNDLLMQKAVEENLLSDKHILLLEKEDLVAAMNAEKSAYDELEIEKCELSLKLKELYEKYTTEANIKHNELEKMAEQLKSLQIKCEDLEELNKQTSKAVSVGLNKLIQDLKNKVIRNEILQQHLTVNTENMLANDRCNLLVTIAATLVTEVRARECLERSIELKDIAQAELKEELKSKEAQISELLTKTKSLQQAIDEARVEATKQKEIYAKELEYKMQEIDAIQKENKTLTNDLNSVKIQLDNKVYSLKEKLVDNENLTDKLKKSYECQIDNLNLMANKLSNYLKEKCSELEVMKKEKDQLQQILDQNNSVIKSLEEEIKTEKQNQDSLKIDFESEQQILKNMVAVTESVMEDQKVNFNNIISEHIKANEMLLEANRIVKKEIDNVRKDSELKILEKEDALALLQKDLDELKTMKEEIEIELEAQLKALNLEIDSLRTEVQNKESEVIKLKKENETLVSKVQEYKENLIIRETENNELKINMDAVESELHNKVDKLTESVQEQIKHKQIVTDELAERTKYIIEMENKLKELDGKVNHLEQEKANLIYVKDSCDDYSGKNAELEAELQKIKAVNMTISEDLAEFRKYTLELEEKSDKFKADNIALEEQINTLTQDNAALKEEFNKLKNTNYELEVQLSQTEKSYADTKIELEKLKIYNTEIEEEICKLKIYATDLEVQLEKLKKDNTAFEVQLDSLRKQNTDVVQELDTSKKLITKLEADLHKSKQHNTDITVVLSALKNDNNALEEELSQVKKDNSQLKHELSTLKEEYTDMKVQTKDVISQFEEDLGKIKQNNTDLWEELNQSRMCNAQLEANIKKLNNDNKILEENLDTLENDNNLLKLELGELRKLNTEIDRALMQTKNNNSELAENLNKFKKNNTDAASELSKQKEHNIELEGELDKLQTDNATVTKDLIELKKMSTELEKKYYQSKNNNKELEVELNKFKEDNIVLAEQLGKLKKYNTELQVELEQLKNNNIKLEDNLNNFKKNDVVMAVEVTDLKKYNATLEVELAKLKNDKTSLEEGCDKLKDLSTKLEEELGQSRSNNTELKTEFDKLKRDNMSIIEQVDTLKKCKIESESKINSLKLDNTKLSEEIDVHDKRIQNLTEEINSLKAANITAAEESEKLKRLNTELEEELANSKSSKKEIEAELNKSKIGYTAAVEEIDKLKKCKIELEVELDKFKIDVAKLTEEINVLQKCNKGFTEEINALNRHKTDLAQTIIKLEKENVNLTYEIMKKTNDIKELQQAVKGEQELQKKIREDLATGKESLVNKCDILQDYHNKAEKELEERQKDIISLQKEVQTLQTKIDLCKEHSRAKDGLISKMSKEKDAIIVDIKKELQDEKELKEKYTKQLEEKTATICELKMKLMVSKNERQALDILKNENAELIKAVGYRDTMGARNQDIISSQKYSGQSAEREVRDLHYQVDNTSDLTHSSTESLKTITDLEKIIYDKNRTITTLQSDVTYLKTIMAESETKLLDVTKELEVSKENCDQLSAQLKKIVHQKNEEIAELKKQVIKMTATENRATQIIKVSAKYQAIILKRIAEIKSNTVLKELTNFGNSNSQSDTELRRGLTAGSITMEDLENFLETTERHLKKCADKQIILQKERDRLVEVNRINESEIINLNKFLTELAVSFQTFSSVKDLYAQKLSRVISVQRTVRREILSLEGHVGDGCLLKLERGYAAAMQDLAECALTLERWVQRWLARSVSAEKIKQAYLCDPERASLAPASLQHAGLEVQLDELEGSFQRLLEDASRAARAGGSGAEPARQPEPAPRASTVMEVRAEYEDKLNRMKAKMKQLYTEQIAVFKEKQKQEVGVLERELARAREQLAAARRAYELHIRALTAELWHVGERLLDHRDEAEWLRKRQHSGSFMSLQNVHSSGLVPLTDPSGRPSEAYSLRSLPVNNNDTKREGRGMHMSDEEGEVFDNRCLKELSTPARDNSLRLSELRWRNSLCPPHLKSSYPAETQFAKALDEQDIKAMGTVGAVGVRQQRKEVGITAYKKPGPPTPSKQAGRLSATDSELRESLRVEAEPQPSRKTSTPSRIRSLFRSSKSETIEGTPRSRRLSSIFRKK